MNVRPRMSHILEFVQKGYPFIRAKIGKNQHCEADFSRHEKPAVQTDFFLLNLTTTSTTNWF
jgi:hypothetical protein